MKMDRSNPSAELSEREKMMRGLPYLAMKDRSLLAERMRAKALQQRYNNYPWPSPEEEPDFFGPDERKAILAELFGLSLEEFKAKPIEIEPPFFCDFGTNIHFQGPFYCNTNVTILDCAKVTFGSRVLLGSGVQLYSGTHSTDIDERQQGYERAYPIEIGDDAWIGGGVIICGPCKIGKGVTVGAGAVVRSDLPDYTVCVGVPARVVKKVDPPSGKVDLSAYRDV